MSITAEKISKERIEELRCRADDVKRYSKAPRPTMAVFADDILAILSLLQQGEPEGWKETLEAIRDKANAAVSHVGRANYRERQTEAHQWVNEAVDAAMLSASPLPPAPGAETGEKPDFDQVQRLREKRTSGESGYTDALWTLHDKLTDLKERDAVREAISVMTSSSRQAVLEEKDNS
ncbi:MAG: hypothetical protein KIT15_16895 [Xanthobacteraceae bacterium]|nr:hypothetical protein [Xanthobacteraceae bacterium]